MHILKFTIHILKFTKENIILLLAVFAIAFVASPAVLYFVAGVDILGFIGHKETEIGKWGTVGDYFGGILNPILTFLGLYLLLQTIKIQRRELELSRKEFTRSVNALEEQGQQMALQAFDNTFFQLLSLHYKNMDFWRSISFQDVYDFHLLEMNRLVCEKLESAFQKANAVFESDQIKINPIDICNILSFEKPKNQASFLKSVLELDCYKDRSDEVECHRNVFSDIYLKVKEIQVNEGIYYEFHERILYNQKNRSEETRLLNMYLKGVFNILKVVDSYKFGVHGELNGLSEIRQGCESNYIQNYIQMLKLQISEFEWALIFYGAYTSHLFGEPEFKVLIEKYTLFENFPENLLLIPEHKEFYSSSAYSKEQQSSHH